MRTAPPARGAARDTQAGREHQPHSAVALPTQHNPAHLQDLTSLADRIRSRLKRTVADTIATGADLIEAKQKLPHGAFTKWIDAEFGMSDRTAQNYMRAAEWAAAHDLRSETVSVLPAGTVYKIAASTTPNEIKTEVAEKIKAGAKIEVGQIEATIGMARAEAAQERRSKARRRKIDNASPARRKRLEQEELRRQAETEKRNAAELEAAAILTKLPADDLARLIVLMKSGIWIHNVIGRLRGGSA